MSVNATQQEIATKSHLAPRWTFAGASGLLSGACWRHDPAFGVEVTTTDHVIVLHSGGGTRVRRFDEQGRLVANGSRLQTIAIMPAGSCSIWEIEDPCEVVHLYVPATLLEHHARQRGLAAAPELPAWFGRDDPWLSGLFRMVQAEVPAGATGAMTTLLLDEIGTILARHLITKVGADAATGTAVERPRGGLSPAALRRVLDAMHADPSAAHRIAELAADVAMNDDHFIRAFRQSIGVSPHRYVLGLRMKRAEDLLADRPRRSVADVARCCGFTSAAHFGAQFRRATGLAPNEWRRTLGADIVRTGAGR
ncbi:MAG: helix-turn-helix domain-containing protein [Burkholderiaceae bacterium]